MEEITIRVYRLDELDEQAQQRAVDQVRELLGGSWWDSADNDDVQAAMLWELAHKLGTPGVHDHGEADFPGIDGVRIDGWDLSRGQSLAVTGRLDRDTAPSLPWAPGLDHVELTGYRSDSTKVDACARADECECPADQGEHDVDCKYLIEPTDEEYRALEDAVQDALHAAWSAGEKEAEYKTSEEQAREVAGQHRFTEDGRFYD